MSDSEPQVFQRSPVPEPLDPAPQPPSRGSGVGCWLWALLVGIVFVALIIGAVILFLPPFNLLERIAQPDYVQLDGVNNAIRSPDGRMTVIVSPQDSGQGFGVALQGVPLTDFTASSSNARAAVPSRLTPAADLYRLESTGTAPSTLNISLRLPDGTNDNNLLDLYGWYPEQRAWRFVPSQLSSDGIERLITLQAPFPQQLGFFQSAVLRAHTVLVSIDGSQTLRTDVANTASIITPAGLFPLADGSLGGSLAAGAEMNAPYRTYPLVRNFSDPRAIDIETVLTLISDPTLREAHIQQLSAAAAPFGGLFIDYRELPADQRPNFSAFISELGAAFHARNLRLGVVVPPAQNATGAWESGAYHWQVIGASSDYVQINLERLNPTDFVPSPERAVEAMLRWGVGEVERGKLLVGLSALSGRQAAGGLVPIGYSEALSPVGNVIIEGDLTASGQIIPGQPFTARLDGFIASPGFVAEIQTPYIDYLDPNRNPIERVWLTTDEAIHFRLTHLEQFGVGGVAFSDILNSDLADNVLGVIANYRLGVTSEPSSTELTLKWRIEDANGIVDEIDAPLYEPLVATVSALEGNYSISAVIVAESVETVRSGVSVALAQPTPSPTPLPSPTPRPTATPTSTPDPTAVAQAQAEATENARQIAEVMAANPGGNPAGGGFSAFVPGAGSIRLGQFEYGGHVTDARSERAAAAMRQAGMTWMKIQIAYDLSGSTAQAAEAITAARAQGFKILIAAVGYEGDMVSLGDNYFRAYAGWLADVARLGPDAIEVWNEPNLDRTWPTGQVDGGYYTQMLQASYTAIKSANPSVLVISGALAPTGAEAAFPGRVVNDDRFLRQMVDAGALNYMDCLGMHYNEGIIPPSATSGDPRDNYYSRYFGTLLDLYWGTTGGARPICITELGYLSSEGYGSLPSFFAWASNVTVAQQSAWLAEAAALASQSGKIQMMIVWNVDFTYYGGDPQGGYAIIRPDGSCPACNALAGAR